MEQAGGGGARAGVLAWIPPRLRQALQHCPETPPWLEIRLRLGNPLLVLTAAGEMWVGAGGAVPAPAQALCCAAEDIEQAVQLITRGSLYAWERELREGFCTLPGGHRVGLAGRARTERGRVVGQTAFAAINIRVARQVRGAADALLLRLGRRWPEEAVLLFGPPGSGKTTVLRDLCRQLSEGNPRLGLAPRRVVVVDERSELAAAVEGRPQFDLGPRSDVLDGWPKRDGLLAAIRALGPQVVACDELGGPGDAQAVAEAARCGVQVLATAHATRVEDLWHRPGLRRLLAGGVFGVLLGLGADRQPRECVFLDAAEPRARRRLWLRA